MMKYKFRGLKSSREMTFKNEIFFKGILKMLNKY